MALSRDGGTHGGAVVMLEGIAMQPTELQVERSLAALQGPEAPGTVGEVISSASMGAGPGSPSPEVPADVRRRVDEVPELRVERLEEARRRLEVGEQPSADALARRMVGRIVCDRLR